MLQSRNFGRKEVQIPISNGWSIYGSIAGFEYEKDYEYKIKVSETNYLNYSMDDPAWIERDLFEVISRIKKIQRICRCTLFLKPITRTFFFLNIGMQ